MLGTKLTYLLVTRALQVSLFPPWLQICADSPLCPIWGAECVVGFPLWHCPARPDVSCPGSPARSLQGSPQEIVEEMGDGDNFCIPLDRGRCPNSKRPYEVRVGAEGCVSCRP